MAEHFEGPEKTLEVCLRPGVGPSRGLRELTRAQLDALCQEAQCTILSSIHSDFLDAYLLSESSLFVYPEHLVLKTCGTTTLLRCLPLLLRMAEEGLGMEVEWVGYSRKNYTSPLHHERIFPHADFNQELAYLDAQAPDSALARLQGAGYVLGPVTGDHLFVYVADNCERPDYESTDRTLSIMMFDLDPDFAALFHKKKATKQKGAAVGATAAASVAGDASPVFDVGADPGAEAETEAEAEAEAATGCATAREMTERSGIRNLVPKAALDDFAFEPCGYSMNAICHDAYTTIHVTPEEHCSYGSFETNTQLPSYTSLIRNVLHTFGPQRFVLTLLIDEAGNDQLREHPFDADSMTSVFVPRIGRFQRRSATSTQFESDCCCFMATYDLVDPIRARTVASPNVADMGMGVSTMQQLQQGQSPTLGANATSPDCSNSVELKGDDETSEGKSGADNDAPGLADSAVTATTAASTTPPRRKLVPPPRHGTNMRARSRSIS